ncbi:Rv3235 family protein [Nocardioides jensenii]|uniref:Rv3235 family protein n=1 Tax=Nocardioides jensenii TaxID=1843 RepID=UPI000B0FF2F3|nr:Rv3235 family protein [Nocardioides jensenii]
MSTTPNNVRPLVSPRQPVEAAGVSFQGTLALDLDRDLEPPWAPDQPTRRGADVVAVSAPTRHDLHRWIVTFAQACVEVIGGDRPASQLIRWTSPQVHTEVAYRAGVVARAGVHAAGHGRGRRPTVRSQVQTVHTCFLAEDIVEFCVRVKHGERSRCLAGRLDVVAARWQCTALEFG